MKREEFINYVRKQIPNICIEENEYRSGIHYGGGSIDVFNNFIDLGNEDEIQLHEVDFLKADEIIDFIKNLKEKVDSIRRDTTSPHDQLIFIHPDCDEFTIPEILRDFKKICNSDRSKFDGWSLGILSSSDWNFSNDALCDLLMDNSGDCFAIQPEQSAKDCAEDWDMIDLYEELKKSYPEIDNIPVFSTDFD